jgi:signal peptidase
MRPTIKKGSLVFTVKQKYYFPGDIITFYDRTSGRELIITHRIYRIGGNVYLTKGDANIAIDKKPVLPRLIIGRVFLIIPFLGYFVSIIKNPIGTIFFILLPAIMIIANELKKIKIYLLD